MSGAYYNEIDPKAAAWLRQLMSAGLISQGFVDERSIEDVRAEELNGYAECHFFAGIGGWPLALRLADWPEGREVWTGSCPCQPLSCAGQHKGHEDRRHLWPSFYRLISQRQPATVFGEQVASEDGREWFAGIRADLEDVGYACGGSDLCAAGIGSPHIRQRIYWAANSLHPERRPVNGHSENEPYGQNIGRNKAHRELGTCSEVLRLVNPDEERWSRKRIHVRCRGPQQDRIEAARPSEGVWNIGKGFWSRFAVTPCLDGTQRRFEPESFPMVDGFPFRMDLLRGYGNAIVPELAAEFIQAFQEATNE